MVRMSPFKDLGADIIRDKQAILRAVTRLRLLGLSLEDPRLDLPGDGGEYTGRWQDGFRIGTTVLHRVLTRKSIRSNILGTWTITEKLNLLKNRAHLA